MKLNKKLKMPMIVFGILLLLAGITFRIISYTTANSFNTITSGGKTTTECNLWFQAMRHNLLSTLFLLSGVGAIAFASRIGQISGTKLAIACFFFIGFITLSVLEQMELTYRSEKKKNCPADAINYYGKQNNLDTMLIHVSNACAIFGITALLL